MAKSTAGVDLRANPAVLAPVSNRQILVRMLSNLKAIYLRGEAFDKARQVLDLLIEAMPEYAAEYLAFTRPDNIATAMAAAAPAASRVRPA